MNEEFNVKDPDRLFTIFDYRIANNGGTSKRFKKEKSNGAGIVMITQKFN